MALDQVANFVRDGVTSAINAGETTIQVENASAFPDPTNGKYNVVVWDAGGFPRPDQDPDVEIMRVTARDTGTNELTVTRAQEGTSDVSHPDSSELQLSPTAKMLDDVDSELEDIEPNTPGWVEDDNSPLVDSGAQSHQITLSTAYDRVLVFIQEMTNNSGGFQSLGIRVNGDTGDNYRYSLADGSESISVPQIDFQTNVGDGDSITGDFRLEGSQGDVGYSGPVGPAVGSQTSTIGSTFGASPPVTSITFRGDGGNISIKARVFGWNGGL